VGTLSRNRFWDEAGAVRAAHATTTLLRDGTTTVIIDPSLPDRVLEQRLDERTGLKPASVDVVFLTNFRPLHRMGIGLFQEATWLIHDAERAAIGEFLASVADSAEVQGRPVDEAVEQELALLTKFEVAPEQITDDIHLFPSPGVTPGAASLMACNPDRTIVVAGDAVISREYFQNRQAFEQHADPQSAVASLAEIAEIGDIIVPGHGDWILNP
jgi:glyoxylase-like metal-dependent hydrolase (beta-lactamase superfamily II)